MVNQEKAEGVRSSESKKHFSKKALVARLAAVLVVATAGYGSFKVMEKHHNDFGIENSIAGWADDFTNIPYELRIMYNMWQREKILKEQLASTSSIPDVFETNGESAVMKVGVNAEPAKETDLAKIKDNIIPPTVEKENGVQALPQFVFLTPFKLHAEDTVSVQLSKSKGGFDSTTGKLVDASRVFYLEFIVSAQGREVIPGIIDPKAKSFEAFKNAPFTIEGKEYFGGSTVKVTREDGSMYYVSLSSFKDARSLVPLPILDKAPTITDANWISQKGVEISSGTTSIMKTGIPNSIINVSIYEKQTTSSKFSGFSGIQLLKSDNGNTVFLSDQP